MKITIAVTKHCCSFQDNSYMRRPDVFLLFVGDPEDFHSGSVFSQIGQICVVQYLETYFFPIFMSLLCPNSKRQ